MPKMKTEKEPPLAGAKITGTGRLRRRHTMRAHILEKKASKRKRRLGREATTCRGRSSGAEAARSLAESVGGPGARMPSAAAGNREQTRFGWRSL